MKLCAPLLLFLTATLSCLLVTGMHSQEPSAVPSQPNAPNSQPAKPVVVYVSDFELHAVVSKQAATGNQISSAAVPSNAPSKLVPRASPTSHAANPPAVASQNRAGPPSQARTAIWEEEDSPEKRASKLVEFMSASLLKALQKEGYTAHRLLPGRARPAQGVLLRGVFAEVEENNRVRRAILGSGSPSPEFLLYVSVQNLARPDQPLYELANPKSPGPPTETRFGPLITITSYAPVAKFELSKDPGVDEVEKIAAAIASHLTELLNANPAALPH